MLFQKRTLRAFVLHRQGVEHESGYVSGTDDLKGWTPPDLAEGRPIQKWSKEAWLKSDAARSDGPAADILANHLGLLVFSQRAQTALDDAGIFGVQYLPIRVFKSDGSEHLGYSVANILNRLPVVDSKRSKTSTEASTITSLQSPGTVLNAGAFHVYHILRPEEFLSSVCVSRKFVDTWTRHGLTGCFFTELKVYDDYPEYTWKGWP